MSSQPFVINLASTGMVPTRKMSPHVPLNQQEIVENVAACLELGVQMFHLHARDADGHHTGEPEVYGRMIEAIRKLPGGDTAILCVTTSGRVDNSFSARSRVLDLDGSMKPDMASLTLSSLNFQQQASTNPPETIRLLARKMLERRIRPELEIFDLGMANFLSVLLKEDLVKFPCYVNLLLGNVAGGQASDLHLAAIRLALPLNDCLVSVAGIGREQLRANILGLLFADGVRIGLEDNLWQDQSRQTYATNASLVQRILRVAGELERPLYSSADLRARLKIEVSNHEGC